MDPSGSCDPIYSLIDDDKYAEAIRYCQRPEMRSNVLANALYAYCLSQTKQVGPAIDVARVVMQGLHDNESINLAISHTLKTCRKEDELATYYDSMSTAHPQQSSHYLVEMFFIYTRMLDSKKMQLTAQRLYKLTSQRNYVFWSVASMLHQAALAPMMLTVAEKMLSKIFESYTTPGCEELELYVLVLCKQEKFELALRTLETLNSTTNDLSPPGIQDQDAFEASNGSAVKAHALQLCAMKLKVLGYMQAQTSQPSITASRISPTTIDELVKSQLFTQLTLYPDQWDAHVKLIASVMNSPSIEIDGAVVRHREYLLSLVAGYPYLRGPRLAEMELLKRWASNRTALPLGWSPSLSSILPIPPNSSIPPVAIEYLNLITNYVSRFQSKQSSFSDIRVHVEAVVRLDCLDLNSSKLIIDMLQSWAGVRAAESEVNLRGIITASSSAEDQESIAAKKTKKKKKEKSAGFAESAGLGALTMEQEAVRCDLVEKLCACCKMQQIVLFCKTLRGMLREPQHADVDSEFLDAAVTGIDPFTPKVCQEKALLTHSAESVPISESAAISLYLSTKRLCQGGVGGEKEVQPGDELLLCVSAIHRAQLARVDKAESSCGEKTGGSVSYSMEAVLAAARWARLLLLGTYISYRLNNRNRRKSNYSQFS